MNNRFIETLTFDKLSSIILSSRKRFIFSSANLHDDIAIAISEASKKGVEIIIIIDPTESNYRNGLGDIKALNLLEKHPIKIFEVPGNQISFILADELGYIFFPQSKIFIDEPKGPNAILMNDILKYKILAHYFPPKTEQEKSKFGDDILSLNEEVKKEILNISMVVQSDQTDISIYELNQAQLEVVKENLKFNPPVHPDFKRKIETYTTKVQFAELKFEGSNFQTKKIKIPKEALPYKDAELKKSLETKLNLFSNLENNEDIKKFNAICVKDKSLRSNFLIPITCRNKSIIKVSKKKEFKEKVSEIEKDIENFRNSTLEKLEEEVLNRKEAIKNALLDFLKENPPKDYKKYSTDLFTRKIQNDAHDIVSRIRFPKLKDILLDMELKYNFYDLTIEDFRDEELISEFRKKGILTSAELDEIVAFKDAFEAAK